jgi:GNAT superfamily N-acetyltransferase
MLARFRAYLEAHGLRRTLAALARRPRRLLYSDERLIVLLKRLDSIVEPRRPGDLRVEDLEERHLPALSELNRRRGRPHVDKRFEAGVAAGFHGFVAWLDELLVGYYWWVDGDAPVPHPDLRDLDLGIELQAGEVYGTDFFLLEDYRGAGRAAAFLYAIEKSLRDRGYGSLWGYVDAGNRAALWSYRSRGYESMWVIERKRRLWIRRQAVLPV